jgi:Rrf2 family protein
MMIDLAEHYGNAPVHIGDIAKRQDISVKYLEQLIIPLKKAQYIKSIRGPKGGHMLAKAPENITVGEIVRVLEGGIEFMECLEEPDSCERSSRCPVRDIWGEAANALKVTLDSFTLSGMMNKDPEKKQK